LNNPQGISINDFLLIGTEIVKTTNFPTVNAPYTVTVSRAQEGTRAVDHSDNTRVVKLFRQQSATYIFPQPVNATTTSINLADFSGTINVNDILRINKGTTSEEYVQITQINQSDAQFFVVNDGNVGTEAVPLTPKDVFKVISTTGDTTILGDVTIGYDDGVNSSTASGSGANFTTGGGNLKIHNSVEISGNSLTTLPGKQYFAITNGTAPKLYVQSSNGNTSLYDGANFKIFKDSFFTTGTFDKTRVDVASNIALEVLGASGNTRISGTLAVGDDLSIKNGLAGANTFTVDAQTGTTFVGRYLSVNGLSSASPSTAVLTFEVDGLGVSGNKPFIIKQDASIDAFGQQNFFNKNGGRRTIYISTSGGAVAGELETNVTYLVRPTNNLTVTLPSTAITGDIVRFVDVAGSLKYNIGLYVNAPTGIKIQGNNDGGYGQLIVQTPNAAFGLLYVGDSDANNIQIPEENRGWWLMEI
jgi:hypothetical protein